MPMEQQEMCVSTDIISDGLIPSCCSRNLIRSFLFAHN